MQRSVEAGTRELLVSLMTCQGTALSLNRVQAGLASSCAELDLAFCQAQHDTQRNATYLHMRLEQAL